jgi:hypothetical protein
VLRHAPLAEDLREHLELPPRVDRIALLDAALQRRVLVGLAPLGEVALAHGGPALRFVPLTP